MKAVPHSHLGQVELCYDRFCTRLTTTEEVANFIGGVFAVGVLLLGLATIAKALSR